MSHLFCMAFRTTRIHDWESSEDGLLIDACLFCLAKWGERLDSQSLRFIMDYVWDRMDTKWGFGRLM